jgi:hypothetical protein
VRKTCRTEMSVMYESMVKGVESMRRSATYEVDIIGAVYSM